MTTATIQYDEANLIIKKTLDVLKALGVKISKKVSIKDNTKMSKEEFYSRIDEAKKQAEEGKTMTFSSASELMSYMETL